MSPLFNERLSEGQGARRTSQQNDYAEFLKRWDEKLGRELTDAEIAQRRLGNVGNSVPPPPSEYATMIANEEERRQKFERERPAREAAARKQKLAAFELAEKLAEDERMALGIETPTQDWDLTTGVTRKLR